MMRTYFYSFVKNNKIKVAILILCLSLYFGLLAVSMTLTGSIPEIAAIPLKSIGIETIVQKTGKIPERMVGIIFPHSNAPINNEEMKKITGLDFVEAYDLGIYMWIFEKTSFKSVFGVREKPGIVSDILKKNIREGKFSLSDRDILITGNYALKNSFATGDHIKISGDSFIVRGILKPNVSGNIIPADIYMNIKEAKILTLRSSDMKKLYRMKNEDFSNVILLKSNPVWKGDKEKTVKAIDNNLLVFSEKTFSAEITDQLKIISASGSIMFLVMGLILLTAFSLLIVFNFKTRSKEIAILRMIGWKLRDLKKQFIGETFVLLLVSIIAGNCIAVAGLEIVSTRTVSMELPWDISAKPHFLPQENSIERTVTAHIPVHTDWLLLALLSIGFILLFLIVNYALFHKLRNIKPYFIDK